MSLGASMSGIQVRAAIEIDPHSASTYAFNHPDTNLLVTDVTSISNPAIRELQRDVTPTLVFAGPPCQGFSYSNPRHRSRANDKNWLFKHFLRFINVIGPRWVVIENVPGIRDTAKGFFLSSILKGLQQQRYRVCHGLLDAADYGVPQHRRRYFIVGHRQGVRFSLPQPTVRNHVTVDDAIGDLPPLQNGNTTCKKLYGASQPSKYAKGLRGDAAVCYNNLVTKNNATVVKRYHHIPQGGNWTDVPKELMSTYQNLSRCHTGIYHRLRANAPAIVIGNFRKNMLVHPTEQRGLSVREAARLQSFPDDYRFFGTIGFQQQQVSNAVPPLLAKSVFDAIVRAENPA